MSTLVERFLRWLWRRWRPSEGWLPVVLLWAAVNCLVAAVVAADWAPEGRVVIPTANLGLLLGIVLAKRHSYSVMRHPSANIQEVGHTTDDALRVTPHVSRFTFHTALQWFLILSYGLLITIAWLGRLWPPLYVWVAGQGAAGSYVRRNWTLLVSRLWSWYLAVAAGGVSHETVVFAFGLGFLTWLLAAYAGWAAFRRHRPLAGLAPIGLALAINGYYGSAPLWPAVLFAGLAALLVAAVHYADLEQTWTAGGVDYSLEIRFDLLLAAGGMALTLLSAAFVVPSISLTKVAKAVLDRPAVRQAEESLERAFAGVQSPRHTLTGDEPEGGQSDVLPRAFLLGNAPELAETVVMTATVDQTASLTYWREATYSDYTGRGWQLAAGFEETVAAGQPVYGQADGMTYTDGQAGGMTHMGGQAGGMTYTVEIRGQAGGQASGMAYYTMGLPQRFNQVVTVHWYAPGDLAWISGVGAAGWYTATSTVAAASPDQLRQSRTADAPPDLLARYTALTDTVPGRVHELAQEIVRGEMAVPVLSPYDQARAIEAFLRQYPYSLEVELPPAGRDPVDYFLFELQRGYCDYYASAMVVLARSLGLPARLVTGYLAAPPDDQGVQTIYEANAHSWPELYFAGYGWFGFEPTAAFSSTQSLDSPERPPIFAGTTTLLPVPAQDRSWPTDTLTHPLVLTLVGLAAVGLATWWWWRRRPAQAAGLDAIQWTYGRLLHSASGLGQPVLPSQTPAEFAAAFLSRLQKTGMDGRVPGLTRWLTGPIRRLTTLYETRQYGRAPITIEDEAAARQLWQTIRRPLWQLRLRYRLRHKIAPPP